VAWVPRADGRGNEIAGVTQAQMDAYSTRTMQVHEKERELAQAWERRHGRAPTSRELLCMANDATLQSRKGKDAARVDWDALAARWDATLGGQLAGIAPAVSNARGPDATAPAAVDDPGPAGPLSREAQARALANGDILRIEAITGSGLMVRRLLQADPATGQRRFTGRAFCYAGYQTSDLAYAITGHSAQGATVHTGIALVTGTEDRQWLYPGHDLRHRRQPGLRLHHPAESGRPSAWHPGRSRAGPLILPAIGGTAPGRHRGRCGPADGRRLRRVQPGDGHQHQSAPHSAWECLEPASRLRLGRVGSLTQTEVPGDVRRARCWR